MRRPATPAAVKLLAHLVKRLADLVRHTRSIRRPRAGGLVAVGDSITTGTGEPRFGLLADDSWVTYVVGKGKVRYGFNAAVSGQTTQELVQHLPAVLDRRPRVVVIATGTNDTDLSQTLDLIRATVVQIREAGAEPVLATIPPLVRRAHDIAVFNTSLRRLAETRSLRILDFNAVLADGDDFKAGLSDDGMHPNVRGSQVMARAAEPILIDVLAAT